MEINLALVDALDEQLADVELYLERTVKVEDPLTYHLLRTIPGIGKLKLVTPEVPLTRGTDGLFRGADGDLSADPNAQVQDGALEGSNVSSVETMVAMITAARQFEAQMKMLQTAEGNEKSAAQLLSMS